MPYKYFAFISYRHTDIAQAKKLQHLLEQYNLPTSLKKRVPDAPKRFKVFRDTDELTSGILSEELKKKLDESKFLVVICSPNSAESPYVGEEIAYFRSLGRADRIIPFIIDGIPHSKDKECFNPELTKGNLELLGIDVNAEEGSSQNKKFHKAFLRLVAKMLDIEYSVVWDRARRQRNRNMAVSAITFLAVLGLVGFLINRAAIEQPFNSSLTLQEYPSSTSLPLSSDQRDTVFLYLSDTDIRKSPIINLDTTLNFPNIPGRFRSEPVHCIVSAYGCLPIDTLLPLTEKMNLTIHRNPDTYGHISCHVVAPDGETPLANAKFDFGFIQGYTDQNGYLDLLVPMEYQSASGYDVKITANGKGYALYSPLMPMEDRLDSETIIVTDE